MSITPGAGQGLKPGAGDSLKLSQVDDRNPTATAITAAFQVPHWQEVDV